MSERRLVNEADEALSRALPALAERLGVPEYNRDDGPTIMLTTRSGKSYCVFQLVNAMLDRMDKILPLTKQ